MKKAILIAVLALISVTTIAQVKPTAPKTDTVKAYKPHPQRLYNIQLPESALVAVLQTSQAGLIPYLKAIKLPMDKLDEAQASHSRLQQAIYLQYRNQYVADSISAVKPVKKKK